MQPTQHSKLVGTILGMSSSSCLAVSHGSHFPGSKSMPPLTAPQPLFHADDYWSRRESRSESSRRFETEAVLSKIPDHPSPPHHHVHPACIKGSHSSFPFSSLHLHHHDGNTGTPQVTCCIGTEAQGCTQAPERQGKEKNVASRKRSLAEVLEERKANTPSILPQQHSHLRRHPHRRWLLHQTSSLL